MAYVNIHRGVRISPKKVGPMVNLVRGMSVEEALSVLTFSKQRSAVFIKRGIEAAVANAESRDENIDRRELIVSEARVDSGPTMKRFQPKDRGRSHQILKRTSHITVGVDRGVGKKKSNR